MNDTKQRRIFFFTGLGADERAFSYLKIKVPYSKIYVSWLPPEKNEGLTAYAGRLVEKYGIRKGDILIGLSFGGMVATEISHQTMPALTLLISSAATHNELPRLYQLAGKTGLYKIIPRHLLNKPGKLKYFLFGLQKPEQRHLFDEIIAQADVNFMHWAISRIVCWKNEVKPPHLYKIHGTSDRILPMHRPTVDFVIEGGSHFLTWEKADEVSQIITNLINEKVI